MKLKRKIAIASGSFILISFYSLVEVYGLLISCPLLPNRQAGIQISETLNRSQEASWILEQKFVTLDELIAQGFYRGAENIQYSMEIVGNSVFSQGYVNVTNDDICTRKKAPLLSAIFMRNNTPTHTYISAIFAMPNTKEKVKKIVCVANTPGWQKLNRPYLKDGEPICASATRNPVLVTPF